MTMSLTNQFVALLDIQYYHVLDMAVCRTGEVSLYYANSHTHVHVHEWRSHMYAYLVTTDVSMDSQRYVYNTCIFLLD